MARFVSLLLGGLLLCAAAPAGAQTTIYIGVPAQDFPPGLFTDGGQYKLSDFSDKLLVMYFFEFTCPRCREAAPQRSATVMAYKGKPVKFLAIAPNVTLAQAQQYQKATGLAMPIFADSLGLMQARYGFKISLQNIMQTRYVGPTGKIEVGFDFEKATLDEALKKTGAHLKYNHAEYDAKMKPALDLLEYGQLGPAMKVLAPFAKSSNKAIAEAAKKLTFEVKADAEKWKAEADDQAIIDPLKAYDLYQKAATAIPADEIGKSSAAAAKKLATDKSIAAELTARKAYTALIQNMSQVTAPGKPAIVQSCKSFLKKYPGTQMADKVDDLYKELTAKEPAGKELGGKTTK